MPARAVRLALQHAPLVYEGYYNLVFPYNPIKFLFGGMTDNTWLEPK